MDRILDWIDRAERARACKADSVRAWMIRQRADMTYPQRLVSMIERADLEKRPPPDELRSFLFRGMAYELVSWPINGYHPGGCVWFPTKQAWIILRRSPVLPVISLPSHLELAEHYGVMDLARIPTHEHDSSH